MGGEGEAPRLHRGEVDEALGVLKSTKLPCAQSGGEEEGGGRERAHPTTDGGMPDEQLGRSVYALRVHIFARLPPDSHARSVPIDKISASGAQSEVYRENVVGWERGRGGGKRKERVPDAALMLSIRHPFFFFFFEKEVCACSTWMGEGRKYCTV